MIVTSATKARANFFTLINDVDEPIVITGKRGNKIMISEEDWRALEETNYLASIPGMVESIKKAEKSGDFVSGEDLEW
ncbi:type II toxin-antitoxin system Phd/YefM family antitoxin [Candidatus Saccharibacteria bacterium]|nr:type II toxin-antitoxin system Phd/YefM family antitoxin [Candidatus Saccharibacteria bacterium]